MIIDWLYKNNILHSNTLGLIIMNKKNTGFELTQEEIDMIEEIENE